MNFWFWNVSRLNYGQVWLHIMVYVVMRFYFMRIN